MLTADIGPSWYPLKQMGHRLDGLKSDCLMYPQVHMLEVPDQSASPVFQAGTSTTLKITICFMS